MSSYLAALPRGNCPLSLFLYFPSFFIFLCLFNLFLSLSFQWGLLQCLKPLSKQRCKGRFAYQSPNSSIALSFTMKWQRGREALVALPLAQVQTAHPFTCERPRIKQPSKRTAFTRRIQLPWERHKHIQDTLFWERLTDNHDLHTHTHTRRWRNEGLSTATTLQQQTTTAHTETKTVWVFHCHFLGTTFCLSSALWSGYGERLLLPAIQQPRRHISRQGSHWYSESL